MRFIGITGGIGAGKSEIIKYIEKHYKCRVYLADDVAKKVREKGTDCYEKLLDLLGEEALNDSRKMAAMLFENDELLEKVNSIIHPAVNDYLLSELDDAKKRGDCDYFLVEAALLIECGYKKLVDEMWYVYADENTRIERLMNARGYTKEKALSIIDNQLSDEEFRKGSDFIIDNSGSLEDSYKAVREKLGEWQK